MPSMRPFRNIDLVSGNNLAMTRISCTFHNQLGWCCNSKKQKYLPITHRKLSHTFNINTYSVPSNHKCTFYQKCERRRYTFGQFRPSRPLQYPFFLPVLCPYTCSEITLNNLRKGTELFLCARILSGGHCQLSSIINLIEWKTHLTRQLPDHRLGNPVMFLVWKVGRGSRNIWDL